MVRFLLQFAFGLLAVPSHRTTIGIVGAFSFQHGGKASKTRLFAQQQNNRPVIVAGSAGSNAAQAALGATLALSARDLLRGSEQIESSSQSPLPCQPVIALLATTGADKDDASHVEAELEATLRESGAVSSAIFVQNTEGRYPSIEQYGEVISQCAVEPVLHVIIEGVGAARPLLSPSIASQVSFLGIEPIVPQQARQMEMVLPEVAQRCGSMLQEIADAFGSHECQPSMAMTLDLPLHLSMLRANSVPKSRTAHKDSFLCRDTKNIGDFILVDYQYDYNNPFGGTDPLSCPSREITISLAGDISAGDSTGADFGSTGNGFASAAAYTALRGKGVPGLAAACIASAVGVVFDEGYPLRHDTSTVERIATLAEKAKRAAIEQQPTLRKRYIDFGYK